MTLTRLTLAAVALSALTVTACATMQVNSFVERGADVTRYRTYHWAPADAYSTGDPRLDNNEFSAIGFRLRSTDGWVIGDSRRPLRPDPISIHYHASVAQEVNANGVDQPNSECEDCEPYVVRAGTIVVELVDAHTSRLVWRGWAEGSIDGAIDDQTSMEREIDEAVARIMERLPRRL